MTSNRYTKTAITRVCTIKVDKNEAERHEAFVTNRAVTFKRYIISKLLNGSSSFGMKCEL